MKIKYIISFVVIVIVYAIYFSSRESAASIVTADTTISSAVSNKLAKIVELVKAKPASEQTTFDDQAAFEEKLAAVVDQMPTITRANEPKADKENQIHGLQSEEFIEGHMLAKLRNLTIENEQFISSAQTIYADCAERKDFSSSVRAICFMRAMEISIKLNNPQYIVDLNVPADVRQLALRLVN